MVVLLTPAGAAAMEEVVAAAAADALNAAALFTSRPSSSPPRRVPRCSPATALPSLAVPIVSRICPASSCCARNSPTFVGVCSTLGTAWRDELGLQRARTRSTHPGAFRFRRALAISFAAALISSTTPEWLNTVRSASCTKTSFSTLHADNEGGWRVGDHVRALAAARAAAPQAQRTAPSTPYAQY